MSRNAPYRLDDQIGFILRQANQRYAALFANGIGNGLTPTQWAALVRLGETGPCPQNQLGRLTAMDAATIKGVVERLDKRGLIQRSADPDDGRRLLVLSNDGDSPAAIARLLNARGFGASRLSVLEHLGGPIERRLDGLAGDWSLPRAADLNLVAVECRAGAGAVRLPLTPGLADEAYRHDGQLTKRDVRAVTLAHLAPCPGELLWDVGAGCGSIGIEWMRAHPSCRAIAIEANDERQEHIRHNRDALGVPTLHLVAGSAPEALLELPEPDAIFIGGGVTAEGVLETCWERLRPGGRLLANAVTLQSERVLLDWQQRLGGDLTRLGVAHARPLGGFDTWRQALPITLLELRKPAARKPPRDA